MRKESLLALLAALLITISSSCGMAQQDENDGFEVTSVKVSPPGASQGSVPRIDFGTISLAAMTLKDVIGMSFDLKPYQIIGGPDWTVKQRFDIVGRDVARNSRRTNTHTRDAAIAASKVDMVKLRGLLRDRFSLQFHYETRLMPGFVLLTTKGAKFDATPCSATYFLEQGRVKGEIRLASLAALLKAELGAPVEDKTGLAGCYRLQAKWTMDPSDTSLPQLPTALHDLGLRLQKAKVDTNVLVIDHAELPKPD